MNLHQRRYFKLLENVLELPHELLLMMIPRIYLDLDSGDYYKKPNTNLLKLVNRELTGYNSEYNWYYRTITDRSVTRDYYQTPMTEMIFEELVSKVNDYEEYPVHFENIIVEYPWGARELMTSLEVRWGAESFVIVDIYGSIYDDRWLH